jgi:hypothetical protein
MKKTILLFPMIMLFTLASAQTEKSVISDTDSFKPTENITDYVHLFGNGIDFNSFKNLSIQEAHDQKSLVVYTLNYEKAFLRFSTSNTPPEWGGDSKTEWKYEITYWNLKNNRRFIALATNITTYVSEETESYAFYIHDKNGINRVQWDAFSWNLGDFIGQDYKPLFEEDIWNNPPVIIWLPEEGEEIQVINDIHEFMDNQKAYRVYDSLKLYQNEVRLKFNPRDYF